MLTPTQLARLAAWAGITPDTHKHLFNLRLHCCECGSQSHLANGSTWVCSNDACPAFDYGFFGAKGYKQAQRLVAVLPAPTDPAADAREVDRVWLADVIHTLTALDSPSSHFADVRFVPQLNGGFYCTADAYVPNSLGRKEHCEFGDSATLALLLAAHAAGVPEVAEAMGDEA